MNSYSSQTLGWMPKGQHQVFCRYYLSCLSWLVLPDFSSDVKMSLYTNLTLLQQKLYWITYACKLFPSNIYAAVVVIYLAACESAWRLFICCNFLYQKVNKYMFNMPSKSLLHHVINLEFVKQICKFFPVYVVQLMVGNGDKFLPGTAGMYSNTPAWWRN